MNDNVQPCIHFVDVVLTQLQFEVTGEMSGELPLGISLEYQHQIDEEHKLLIAAMKWDVFGNVPPDKRPPIKFTFTIEGAFKGGESGMTLEEFAQGHAPGHLVPYGRELISSITSRSPLPTLRIGPINAIALMKTGKSPLAASKTKKRSQSTSGKS